MWVSLVEKAYAKLHRCYQALNSGYMNEVYKDISGMDTLQIRLQYLDVDEERITQTLK